MALGGQNGPYSRQTLTGVLFEQSRKEGVALIALRVVGGKEDLQLFLEFYALLKFGRHKFPHQIKDGGTDGKAAAKIRKSFEWTHKLSFREFHIHYIILFCVLQEIPRDFKKFMKCFEKILVSMTGKWYNVTVKKERLDCRSVLGG